MTRKLKRRSFLGLCAAGTSAIRASGAASGAEPIIDSHVHLFLPGFPFSKASYQPATHPLSEYLSFLKQSPIEHVVVVHPEPYQDDHHILEFIFRNEPSRGFFKATCLFDPIDPRTPARMEALSRQHPNRIVAIRIHEVHKPGTPSTTTGAIKDRDLKDPGVRNVFRKARELKMAIQFHLIPHYAAQVNELAGEFPEVPVLLDHLGRIPEGTPAEAGEVLALAKRPNVYMKYLGSYAGDAALARRCYDAFGPDHMMCGYVGLNGEEFRKWSDGFDRAFGGLPAGDRGKLRVYTAKRVFGW